MSSTDEFVLSVKEAEHQLILLHWFRKLNLVPIKDVTKLIICFSYLKCYFNFKASKKDRYSEIITEPIQCDSTISKEKFEKPWKTNIFFCNIPINYGYHHFELKMIKNCVQPEFNTFYIGITRQKEKNTKIIEIF